jgi:hypothetical protein
METKRALGCAGRRLEDYINYEPRDALRPRRALWFCCWRANVVSQFVGRSKRPASVTAVPQRQESQVYREFVDEASKSYIDSITTNTPDLTRLVALYALISRMRSLSSPKVIEEAERVAQLIVRSYPEPNMTFADLRPMITAKAIDPLRSFSESCREELERLK